MYKLCFYVPESHLQAVKDALFEAGAGRIGNYADCCWQVRGEGQFRPLAGSQPQIGKQNRLACVTEYKVEMVCEDARVQAVVNVLCRVHPYEEPAYDVTKIETF